MSSVLSFHGVTRAFRTGAGVHRLTFQLGEGEIVALIGLNGAGKTTLMRLALGMLRAQQGTVRLFGRPLPSLPTAAWSKVGALVERSTAYPELTVAENLDIARRLRGGARHVVTEAITAWQLDQLTDRRYRTLSQGNRQRVGLAAALQHQPRLVVLDEPSNALDPASVLLLNAGRLIGTLDTTGPDLERAFFERIRTDDEHRRAQEPA